MESRFDLRINSKEDFLRFLTFANKNNLTWECGRQIIEDDWQYVKDKICIFWFVDDKYVGFETCTSITSNCKNVFYAHVDVNFLLGDMNNEQV